MAVALCKNDLHPVTQRRRVGRQLRCIPCRQAQEIARQIVVADGRWQVPGPAAVAGLAERQQRHDAWAAGLDAAIAELRRTEGFMGGRWRTLGELLHPELTLVTPAPSMSRRTRPIVACEDCGAARYEGQPCRHCADESWSARFQALARLDVGALIGLNVRGLLEHCS